MSVETQEKIQETNETKQEETQTKEKNEGTAPAIDYSKKISELENALKERDTKISDLSTTLSTIEQRQKQIQEASAPKADDELEKQLERIEEMRLTDPAGAARENAKLFREITSQAALKAQGAMSQQAAIEKLRNGVKSSNPDFDDDVVDYVMERADVLARTGKFKTAQEAIDAATTLVKSKFEGYALKRNTAPPLPEGAKAESGGNTPPAPEPKDKPVPSAMDEIAERKMAQHKKIL